MSYIIVIAVLVNLTQTQTYLGKVTECIQLESGRWSSSCVEKGDQLEGGAESGRGCRRARSNDTCMYEDGTVKPITWHV